MSNPSLAHDSQLGQVQPEIIRQHSDLEGARESLLPGDEFLRVIDAQYDGTAPEVYPWLRLGDDIAGEMENLPRHRSGTARIFEVTVHSDFIITGLRETRGPEATRQARYGLIKFLQDAYAQPFEERRIFRWLNDPLLVNDIGSISSQWSQRLDGRTTHFYRLVNRTSLQQDPLDYDLHPRDSYLTCAQDENDRLIVIIVHDVWISQSFRMNKSSAGISFRNPRSIERMLDGMSWTSLSDGSLNTFAKLLVLDFFLASIYLQPVDYYEHLIYTHVPNKEVLKFSLTKNPHLQVPLGLFEPRLSAKSREAFKEIEDAEGILRSVNNLVDSIDYVVAALKPNRDNNNTAHSGHDTTNTDRSGHNNASAAHSDHEKAYHTAGTQQLASEDYERCMRELEGLCSERRNNAKRALDALNRQLDYLTKRHAIREAKSIKILTILASVYLPLSLSASLLGMQSPFKAIAHTKVQDDTQSLVGTNLLFDFFGIFVGLGTATIFIIYFIRLGLSLKLSGLGALSKNFGGPFSIFSYGRQWRFGGRGGQLFECIRILTGWWIGAGLGITLVVIFLVGMLRTAQSAWDTAKWMFIAYIVVSALSVLCYACTYLYLYSKRLRVR